VQGDRCFTKGSANSVASIGMTHATHATSYGCSDPFNEVTTTTAGWHNIVTLECFL